MLLKTLDELDEKGNVGDWIIVERDYYGEKTTLMFLRYPVSDEKWLEFYQEAPELNRGDVVMLPLSGSRHPVWQWDGNREAPTLTPSINVVGRWHGWLRNGELVTA